MSCIIPRTRHRRRRHHRAWPDRAAGSDRRPRPRPRARETPEREDSMDDRRVTPVAGGRAPTGRAVGGLRRAGLAAAIAGALLVAACSSGQSVGGKKGGGKSDASSPYGFSAAKQDASSGITVWVDSTRLDAAKAYKKANPAAKVKIVTYDGNANGSNTFKTKTQLFDRAGSGWPDV